jgi:phospholipid transport system substrate-binding protein
MTAFLTRRTFVAIAAAFLLTVTAPVAAHADAAAAFVQSMGDKALSSLTAKELSTKERETRVRSLLRTNFDVPFIGRFVLGPHWKSATEGQKNEYFNLFEAMIVRTYAQRFSEYSGQSLKVGASSKASASDYIVSSQIIQKGGPPLSVKWRVRNKGEGFRVIDVIVEDVSMSMTQRSDFSAVIQSGGGKIDALIDTLRKRNKK